MKQVHSSHGDFTIDDNGYVLNRFDDSGELPKVSRFNLAEYVEYWGEDATDYDILDLGYWDMGSVYTEPDHTWRKMIDLRLR